MRRKTLKQILIGLMSGILILSACRQVPAGTITPGFVTQAVTATTSPMPTSTNTLIPTATPTASITPLPTIPTFTPTFDARTIVTVAPVAKAICPTIDQAIKPEDYLPQKLDYPTANITNRILEFLNRGGNGQSLVRRLDQIYSKVEYSGGYAFLDVTGDQISEFLYVELYYGEKPIVFSCENGKYGTLAILTGQYEPDFHELKIGDMNSNGIPEIIITGTGGVSFPQSTIYLYEWNGQAFATLGQVGISALRQTKITDIDGNGTKEIVFTGDDPTCISCYNFIPQRQRTIIYSWSGKEFTETSNEFTPPEYRFQAIQDADSTTLVGMYEKASLLYEEAISNKKLEWWSSDRLTYKQTVGSILIFIATPSAIPTEDPTEYPRLAAYAYYRIMLLHLIQSRESEAEISYNTLQDKFGNDPHGRPYVEMATAFWNVYQSTHKMYDGCAAAIQYAAEHPEILIPLGSDYHGWQSHVYVPADVCPFR